MNSTDVTGQSQLADRIAPRLEFLYGDAAPGCLAQIVELCTRHAAESPGPPPRRWDERDVVLITYGDQLAANGGPGLPSLEKFLTEHGLTDLINTVHILPFCPYSSDDGFSVIDYRAVRSAVGTWDDVRRLGTQVDLMFDLVLNHCSQQSNYFTGYCAGTPEYEDFFIKVAPGTDTSAVTRPRSLPLVHEFGTCRGPELIWTTFSRDQVDLNYAQPRVLMEMLDVLLMYVRRGARLVRLDAVAYLWKELGTSCIHLPQTHAVVKLLRDVLDAVAPHVLLITETNVPHAENVSYFGDQDEAHLVYQFSLPPLLLDAFLSQDARPLTAWLAGVCETAPDTAYFNFTASHDGVGVRPLEGLVPPEHLRRLTETVAARGGHVSTRRQADGTDSPYELNVSYFDALAPDGPADPELHVRRFLSSQAVMLALRGMPAVYFHSLVGTPNYHQGVAQSGQPRRINRRKYDLAELNRVLADQRSPQRLVFDGYRQLLAARIRHAAFHPDAAQEVVDAGDPAVLAFRRSGLDGGPPVLVACNLADQPRTLAPHLTGGVSVVKDLITRRSPATADGAVVLSPCQTVWLQLGD